MAVTEIEDQPKSIRDIINEGGGDLPDDLVDNSLGQSKYDFKSRVFPDDLGTSGSYNGHYMVININVSNYSNFDKVSYKGQSVNTFTKTDELSKVDALKSTFDRNLSAGGKQFGSNVFVPRQTRRIVESIALYMPSTTAFTQANQYEDVSLTGIVKGITIGAASLIGAGGFAGAVVNAGIAGAGIAQAPINPRSEIIFSNTALRNFAFDILLAPSNAHESRVAEEIIRTIRFHAAPEWNNIPDIEDFGLNFDSVTNVARGLFWTPPSEFDITFYNRGKENTHIPRINTCVLRQIDVDYAPKGLWATFSNGHPVSMRIQLQFQEVEVLHRARVLQGF